MRRPEGRGRPKRKAPGVEAGGGAEVFGGLSGFERSTETSGPVPLRVDLSSRLRVLRSAWETFRGADREAVEPPLRRVELEARRAA
jgi:hypothetical protein